MDLDDAVTFTGWLARPEVADRMRRADVFVMPSLCDCGGSVVLEAMVAGLPVIATRWGGPADYLEDQCGLLVDPDSSEGFVAGLAEAMLRLVRSPELRAELARNARRRVTQDFDWDRKIDRLLEIYQQFAAS
jgi:glycosyltransferase involved in cell wall biosynthesis